MPAKTRLSEERMAKRTLRLARCAAAALAATATASVMAPATAQEFTAKSVNLVVGFPPGGGYDTIARAFARHFTKHLPGTPTIVVQNQPGAGSLAAANLLYNAAPKDGSHMTMFASSAVLEPMIGNQLAKYDANKFEWVGNLNRDTPACGAWRNTGIKTWDDVTNRKMRFGASGPAAITAQHAFFLKNVLNVNAQVIMGLGGTGPIILALQRGEIDATCGMFISSVRGSFRTDYEQGNLVIFVQLGKKKHPYFKDARHIYDIVKSDADRTLAEFVFSQAEVTRPLALPPGTPPGIVATLRAGFDKTVQDPDYLTDLAKAQIEAEPMTGAETAAAFKVITSAAPELIERSKAVLSPPKD
jgi:tripartite-type tricarboxylate transporter receptor subunit TctC